MVRGDRFTIKNTGSRLDGGEFIFYEKKHGGIYGWWPGRDQSKEVGLFCYVDQWERHLTPIDNPSDNIPEEW